MDEGNGMVGAAFYVFFVAPFTFLLWLQLARHQLWIQSVTAIVLVAAFAYVCDRYDNRKRARAALTPEP